MSVEPVNGFWYFDKDQKLQNSSQRYCKIGFAKLISEFAPAMIKDNDTNLPSYPCIMIPDDACQNTNKNDTKQR